MSRHQALDTFGRSGNPVMGNKFEGDAQFRDMPISQKMTLEGTVNKTAFSLNTDSIVKSESPNSLDQFIRQRLRWSSKAFNYYFLDSSLELKLMLPFIYLVNIFCVFSIIKFINTPLLIGLLPWIIKSIADGIIIHRMMTLYKYKFSR